MVLNIAISPHCPADDLLPPVVPMVLCIMGVRTRTARTEVADPIVPLLAWMPGVRPDAVLELSEVRNMSAKRVLECTQEWTQQGLEKGIKKGRQESESSLLQRQLILKFGALDEVSRQRWATADSETLPGERVLMAASLADVFAGSAR